MPHSGTNPPLIDLDAVDIKIAGRTVLRDIDWQLRPGRHWGIVGANGSGKTSLLGLIAGTLWPAPGKGRRRYGFDGRVQRDAVEARRRIAVVAPELQDQYTRWGWNFSALDVVLSGLFRTDIPRRRPAPKESDRAEELLRAFGLGGLARRPFLRLSRGEQRRVLIARAMAFEPEVLLLDEPAAGLDRESRAALDRSLARVGRQAAVVAAAHDADDLPLLTTDVLHLAHGRIASRGRFPAGAAAAGRPPADEPHRGTTRPARRDARAATGAAAPLIDVRHADVWRGGRRVLRDICWRLGPEQHWLVGGPNGSGKSTFLRLLHGQLRPARGGSIAWPALGDPRNVWSLRRQVALVSPELQAEYLFPTTVHDCIASGFESSFGLTRPLTAAEAERVSQLLERFELTALAERELKSLSYGQRRRTLIARTLVNRPRVLLLDEPTEGLDSDAAATVFAQIAASVADGTRLVCATHLDDVGDFFTHTLRLESGEIADGEYAA